MSAKSRFLIEIMPTTKPSGAPQGTSPEEVVDLLGQASVAALAGEMTEVHMAAIVQRMQQAAAGIGILDPEPPGPLRRLRIRCLGCGKQIGGVVTLAAWRHLMEGVASHACKPGKDRYWYTIVRDAFLVGRDEEAISIMRSYLAEEGSIEDEKAR